MSIATSSKNIYVRSISCRNRKTCPTCKVKLLPDEKIWSSGEYMNMRWYTINHFCQHCYDDVVVETCQSYCDRNGAIVTIQMYRDEKRPSWLHRTITSTITVLEQARV